jgi:putative permease
VDRAQVVVVNLLPTALLVLGAVILWRMLGAVRDALLLLTMAAVLASALNPLASWLQAQARLPRSAAGLVAILVPLLVLVGVGWLLVPPFSAQVADFAERLPENVERLQRSLGPLAERYPILAPLAEPGALRGFGERAAGSGGQVASGALSVAGGIARIVAAFVFLVVLVAYMLGRPEPLVQGILTAVPERHREKASGVVERALRDLGAWGRSTVLLMVAVGVLTFIGLSLIGVPNALVYGLIAAVGEAIPTIGPIIAAVPPLLATLATDPSKAIWVLAVAVLVQQLENNVLVPVVYGQGVQLHPVSVMAGVLVFGSIFGLIGAFVAVPLLIVIKAVYEGFYLVRRENVPEGEAKAVLGEP